MEGGTLRKVNAVDEDDYVRVTWAGSKVRQDVHGIVSKWAKEGRPVGGVKGSRGPGAMFGWGAGAHQEGKKRSSLNAGRVAPPLQSHIRHASEVGAVSSVRLTGASPPTPTFGWASFASTPPPKTVSSTQPTPPPPPTPVVNRANGTAKSPLPPTQSPSLPAALPPPKPMPKSSPNKSAKMTRADPKPPQPISAAVDDWASFESLQKQPQPAPAQVSDDWGAFENLVSGRAGAGTSKPVVLSSTISPSKADGEWAAFESFTQTQSPLPSSGSPQSNRNSSSSVKGPAQADANVAAQKPSPAIPDVLAPAKPAVLSISTQKKAELAGDDDDWGEMQSPIKSSATPAPTFLPTRQPTAIASGTNGSTAQNTLGAAGAASVLGRASQSHAGTGRSSNSSTGADNWDLSFFEKSAAVSLPQPQQLGASTAGGDLWDTPPQPQPQAAAGRKKIVSEEDRTLQRIVDGLPSLAYMLT